MTAQHHSKHVFRLNDLPTYEPPGHTGVVNVRLVTKDRVNNHFEMLLGTDEGGGSSDTHSHASSYQVYYIVEGHGEIRIGDDPPEAFGPGSIMIIPPKVTHSMRTAGNQKTRVIIINSPPL
jgi:mannose-6-phosphate isomerase-like protein (cupin superfamily)